MTFGVLESLQVQYDTKMKEYNQLTQDYKALLLSGGNNYVHIKDRQYIGQTILRASREQSINTCQAACSSNPKCTGATFVPNTRNCTLSGGVGSLSTNLGVYAIITRLKQVTGQLEDVNKQLISLNKQIQTAISTNPNNNLDNWTQQNNNLQGTLVTDYRDLVNQRTGLNRLMQEYNSINGSMADTSLEVKQQMLSYRIYSIILVLTLILIIMWIGNMNIAMMVVPLIIAFILFILNMQFIASIVLCIMVLYYIYSIPI